MIDRRRFTNFAPFKKRDFNKKCPIVRTKIVENGYLPLSEDVMDESSKVADVAMQFIDDADRECTVVFCMDGDLKLMSIQEVSVGILNQTVMHAREVFKAAILSNATSVILVHNHPMGDAVPSDADIEITKRLMEAGSILGIPVSDHLVIHGREYTSIAEILLHEKYPPVLKMVGNSEIEDSGYSTN